jgi:hypothetical protein
MPNPNEVLFALCEERACYARTTGPWSVSMTRPSCATFQRLGEVRIAEKTEVAIVERGFRNDEHVPEAAAGLNEKDLGGSVKCEEVAMVTIAEFAPEKLTDK